MSVIRRQKITIVFVAVLIAAQLILTALLCVKMLTNSNQSLIDYTFVIDAGHGGVDGGVVGVGGSIESKLNLIYSKQLASMLADRGFAVVETRKTEDGLYGSASNGFKRRDMEARKQIILSSNADIVISVHMNKYTSSARRGPQVFFQQGSDSGQQLANSVQKSLNMMSGNSHSALSGDYYICRCSDIPSIIVECGFLSNAEDERLLNTDDYRQQLLDSVLYGVMMYLYSM